MQALPKKKRGENSKKKKKKKSWCNSSRLLYISLFHRKIKSRRESGQARKKQTFLLLQFTHTLLQIHLEEINREQKHAMYELEWLDHPLINLDEYIYMIKQTVCSFFTSSTTFRVLNRNSINIYMPILTSKATHLIHTPSSTQSEQIKHTKGLILF